MLKRLSLGRRMLLLVVAVAAAAIGLIAQAAGALTSIEQSSIDTRFSIRGNERPRSNIVIVGVDERSLSQLNAPAGVIPRAIHAKLISLLHGDGARLIAYDFQFIGSKGGDVALERAISAARPVVLATHDTDAGVVPVPAGYADPARLGAILGSVGVPTDSDGVVRRMLYAPVRLRSFDVQAAQVLLGHRVSTSHFPGNYAWIDFTGPPGTYPTVSFSDAVDGRVPPSFFAGKTVLVGATDPVLGDIVQTPVSSTPMAGVEVHANALETILDGFPLQSAPSWVNVLLVLLAAGLPGLLALRLPALYILGGSLGLLALLLVGDQLAFDGGQIVLVPYSVLGLMLAGGGSAAVDSLMTTRQLRSLSESIDRLVKRIDAGDVIGDYRVDALIGKGGMGVVYRATQQSLNRQVALKVIVPELADDPDFRLRFQRESLIAASIDHPNVVPVYEAGEHGNLLFLAMRFIDGVDLRALLKSEGPLAPDVVAHVIEQAAAALAAAHGRGLVHRDVKPANILVDTRANYHVYLTDFGLTRQIDSTTALTEAGMMVGTIDYMAPEQINGGAIDQRGDVYALGCVLYELLTGSVPFERDTEVAKMFAHVSSDVPSASAHRAGLSPQVDEVIRRAMAKRPEERYMSMQEFADAATTSLSQIRAQTD